jgi:hypothetical protein
MFQNKVKLVDIYLATISLKNDSKEDEARL